MDKETLIKALNEDLANEYGAIIQYITYAAKATGPYRPQLAQFFLAEVADESLHAQYLANKIVALGGEPTTEPISLPEVSTNKEMLEAILAAETRAIAGYTERAQQADGHPGDDCGRPMPASIHHNQAENEGAEDVDEQRRPRPMARDLGEGSADEATRGTPDGDRQQGPDAKERASKGSLLDSEGLLARRRQNLRLCRRRRRTCL